MIVEHGIQPGDTVIGSSLVDLAPIKLLKISAGKLPVELSAIFGETDPEFLRSMCKAIFEWKGLESEVATLRVHGRLDFVIPCPSEILDPVPGGHLIAMTYAGECVRRIEAFLR